MGLSESRVRTAVSRLVASERIEGMKDGRKSYYRLTPAAEKEFQRAARLIYRRPRAAPLRGWHLVALPQGPGREALVNRLTALRFGMAEPYLAILPDRGDPLPPLGAPHFRATTEDDLTQMARAAWPLDALAERMARFMQAFAPLDGVTCSPEEALGLRLLLVHVYRDIALSDPALPLGMLPEDWQGPAVRALFAEDTNGEDLLAMSARTLQKMLRMGGVGDPVPVAAIILRQRGAASSSGTAHVCGARSAGSGAALHDQGAK